MRLPNPHHESCPIAPFAHPLVIQFFDILKARNLAMTDVAEKAGTSLTCLVKWKRRHTPTIEHFEKALKAIGYELKIVQRGG